MGTRSLTFGGQTPTTTMAWPGCLLRGLVIAALILTTYACSSSSDDAATTGLGAEQNGVSGEAGNQNTNATETTTIAPQPSPNNTETGDGAEGEGFTPGKLASAATLGSTEPTKPTPLPSKAVDVTDGDVFWRINNQPAGGALLKGEEAHKVVGFNTTDMTLQLEEVKSFRTLSPGNPESLTTDQNETYNQMFLHSINEGDLPDTAVSRSNGSASVPTTGLYVTLLNSKKSALTVKGLHKSIGILAITYMGPTMKGVKVLGDKFVPANKTSVKVDFTSMAAQVRWAGKGFKNPKWKPSEYQETDTPGRFKILTRHNNKTFTMEMVRLDLLEAVWVDKEEEMINTRINHGMEYPSFLDEEEGP